MVSLEENLEEEKEQHFADGEDQDIFDRLFNDVLVFGRWHVLFVSAIRQTSFWVCSSISADYCCWCPGSDQSPLAACMQC